MSVVHIEAKGLYKHFGSFLAVDNISLTVNKGDVLGFLGPNGAGKSTTMRILTGYLEPSAGSVAICGHDVAQQPIEARMCLGYLPEGSPLYNDMSARQILHFIAKARNMSKAATKQRMETVIELLHLQPVLDQFLDTLSKGFKRRVGLAQALLHDPDILILDEPTDGLDPIQKHEVRQLIRDMSAHKSIVISTHLLEEVEAICTRTLIIANGRVVADGSPTDLLERSENHLAIELQVSGTPVNEIIPKVQALSNVRKVQEVDEGMIRIWPRQSQDISGEIGRLCLQHQWMVIQLHRTATHLDEVFRAVAKAGSEI